MPGCIIFIDLVKKELTTKKIKLGFTITDAATSATTYPKYTWTAPDDDWHYVVVYYSASVNDVILPTSGVMVILVFGILMM